VVHGERRDGSRVVRIPKAQTFSLVTSILLLRLSSEFGGDVDLRVPCEIVEIVLEKREQSKYRVKVLGNIPYKGCYPL